MQKCNVQIIICYSSGKDIYITKIINLDMLYRIIEQTFDRKIQRFLINLLESIYLKKIGQS